MIDDAFIQNVTGLIEYSFTQAGMVMTGSLLIFNGLINAVSKRVLPYINNLVKYIAQAIQDITCTDDMGVRMACGIVSDLCADLEDEMAPFVDKLISALCQNLNDPNAHSESKLVSIVAAGDLLMQC